jgi:hypothetical protein
MSRIEPGSLSTVYLEIAEPFPVSFTRFFDASQRQTPSIGILSFDSH